MKRRSISITRRLTVAVLSLELLSALILIGAITIHERHIQLQAFDASLLGNAKSLLGAVQDSEDTGDNVLLDMRGVKLSRNAVFSVEDERGRILGSSGTPPHLEAQPSGEPAFQNININGHRYRFLVLHGLRIVDPGEPNGGTPHSITIVYGAPVGHVWHEVLEAIRFFAIATAILLSVTALVMAWLVRKALLPVNELAREAERISSSDWHFDAPVSAKETVELRPLTAALEAALARLQRSFEQQRRFTSDAAHELKTDVAIIKSSLQLLSMRKRTIEEYCNGLELSLDDFTRLETTMQKMLTLARLEQPRESDGPEAALQSCSLHNAIEDAIHQSKPLAELKTVEIKFESKTDAKVQIDSRDALLLCSNILLNALQHSPEGTHVLITMAVDEEKVQLSVQDQGEGIPAEDRAHVFEPFYRGDPSRSRKSGGTGLGLSICRAICERAGGSIEIANNANGGAVVTVMLPVESMASGSAISVSFKAQ